ncbi:AlpA family transcriptional regulator [Pseudoxanthomonas mexicana]|uniref:helix-turn-helix transcriptional regulator n=1 Tax=Pseudoxanthomonas mexicana TaxID=128785 RepID=UPI00138A6101|nr:AlpA family phage regulatory protein [Pseudoxanthomonas mexicana]KAF1728144.1 AlpA family transcriptional regulator [Pseudoxanthomonas mexicana]
MPTPPEQFYRVTDIVGDRKRGIPAIFPVSKSYWLKGVRAGKFPKPIRLSPGVVVWKGSDIDALIQRTIAAATPVEAAEPQS